jgi:hypothetical protein
MNLLPNEIANVYIFARTGPITEYLMEPEGGVLTAKQVLLNGRRPIFDGQNSPTVMNMGVSVTQPLRIPSLRYGMWVWQNQ